MAVNISLDLGDCTFGQLLAFVDAVESAGATRDTVGRLDGSTLHFSIPAAPSAPRLSEPREATGGVDAAKLGDLAINSLIDALSAKRR